MSYIYGMCIATYYYAKTKCIEKSSSLFFVSSKGRDL